MYRHASSPDRGSVDDEMDVLMSLWESIGEDEEQVKAALTEHGLESTGSSTRRSVSNILPILAHASKILHHRCHIFTP